MTYMHKSWLFGTMPSNKLHCIEFSFIDMAFTQTAIYIILFKTYVTNLLIMNSVGISL